MASLPKTPGKKSDAIPNQGIASGAKKTMEPATPKSKKRATAGSTGHTENETPTKKQRNKPAEPAKIPKSKEELTEADKLMMKLKKEGKTWPQITAAVSALTGQTYGKSSLSTRHARIANALIEWKEGDIERMLFVRKKVVEDTEAAIAAFRKEAENKIWSNMATAMVEIGSDEYSGGAVEKMYQKEKQSGFPHENTVDTVMASVSSITRGNHHEKTDDENDNEGVAKNGQEVEDDEILHSGED